MDSDGLLPCSQANAICPYTESDQCSPSHSIPILKIHFNIILPCTPRSTTWSLSFGFPNQNLICTSSFPRTCHIPRPPHPLWFDHPDYIW